MNRMFQTLFMIGTTGLLHACTGEYFLKQNSCPEGEVRKGPICVNANVAGVSKNSASCVDPDLSGVKVGMQITLCDGSIGMGTLKLSTELPSCTKDGEQDCVNRKTFKAVDTASLSASDVKVGKTIAGITGTARSVKQCRNYSALATFDSSYPPSNLGWAAYTFAPAAVTLATDQINIGMTHGLITNSPVRFTTSGTMPAPLVANTTYYAIYVSATVIRVAYVPNGAQIDITSQGTGTHSAHDAIDSTAQYFDTLDDYNNNQSFSPANNPWSSSDYLCDATNFVNVTSTSAPLLPSGIIPSTANQAFTQIWQDHHTGMFVSNILYDGLPNNRTWSDAVRTCDSLNGSTAGEGWHLPTQKELMQLYIDGISKVSLAGGTTGNYFWSASGVSGIVLNSWLSTLSDGDMFYTNRIDTNYSVLCVR